MEEQNRTRSINAEGLTAEQKRPADPANVRRAALAGLVGTMLENYDFVIYGTASALVFGQLFFPEISPVAGMIAAFSAYAVGFIARPLGGAFFSHFGEKLGRKWVLVTTLFLMGGATFAIGCLPSFGTVGVLAPILLVLCRFLQGFGAGAEQSGGATLLTETAPLGRRGRLSSFVMVGAALGAVLAAGAWVLVQLLPEEAVLSWGWRLVFWSSVVVTVAAAIIRSRMAESPVFEELKQTVDVKNQAPLKVVAQHGRGRVLRVVLMNWGVSTQSYMYQVFLVGYLATVVGVQTDFIPPVQLVASVCAAIAAFAAGWLSDRFGRKSVVLTICGVLAVTPFVVFPGLNTGSMALIVAIFILGYMFAAQGAVGVHMSYFPELFGSRYRYAGVTLGREISAVIGGGIARLLGSSLLAWFMDSWIPIAVYMALTMAVSFFATLTAPETVNRDLTIPTDAAPGEERPGVFVRER